MKKLLFVIGMLWAGVAHAQIPPYGMLIYQGDVSGSYYWGRLLTPSSITDSYLFVYDGAISQPKLAVLGSGLSWNGTTLSTTSGGTVTSVTAGTGLNGGTITTTGTISMPNVGSASTYSGVTTDAQGRVTAGTNRSFATPTRTLNSCFQVSATRDALVSYAVDVTTTVTLGGTPEGAVFLRTYTNSACNTGQIGVISGSNGQPTTLTVSVGQQVKGSVNLYGVVPAGTWARLETSNVSGTPTFSIRAEQQEVQL